MQSPDELRTALTSAGIMDGPDWKEAESLLAPGASSRDEAPPSQSPAMSFLFEQAGQIARAGTTVLILGESGVGKSRLARSIHLQSPRRAGPFVTVSCGSIPETLLESELFGVEKGAFTGAIKSRQGRFQQASGGTIFLDEIGEVSPAIQVKLLRVIQERKIEPLGSGREIEVDVRLVTATNRNLENDVRVGRFRDDLYYRLNVVPLTMLPLRERKNDILPLARYFLERFNRRENRRFSFEGTDIPDILTRYSWPGNIRELENCLERILVLSRGDELNTADFPPRILEEVNYKPPRAAVLEGPRASTAQKTGDDPESANDFPSLKQIERAHIMAALERARGNVHRAAGLLDIHRNTLARKLETLEIDPVAFKKKTTRASGRGGEQTN